MDSQHNWKQQFIQFKQLLQRAKSFNHLVFYNRKLISNYFLSSYGYRLSISRDGHQQSRCVDCGTSFLLDPILQQTAMEVKESFNQVICDHEQSCSFFGKGNRKQLRHQFGIDNNKIKQLGVLLFQELVQQNCKFKQNVDEFFKNKKKMADIFNKKQQRLFQKLIVNKNNQLSSYLLALFGWKILKNLSVGCQYCGQIEQKPQNFDPVQSHHSYCLILHQSLYSIILQKSVINELDVIQGQFLKSESKVYAKKIRTQLIEMADNPVKALQEFQYRIKGIKTSLETMDQQEPVERKRERSKPNQLQNFQKIQKIAQELQNSLKNGIKQVKID